MFKPAPLAIAGLLLGFGNVSARAQEPGTAPAASSSRQTEADEYARYELLAPNTASFKISYEVSATTPGAKVFFNPIRKGSVARDEAVYDAMTGEALRFEVVSGAEARKDPLMADADAAENYIKIELARAVPSFSTAASASNATAWFCLRDMNSWSATCPRRFCRNPMAASPSAL